MADFSIPEKAVKRLRERRNKKVGVRKASEFSERNSNRFTVNNRGNCQSPSSKSTVLRPDADVFQPSKASSYFVKEGNTFRNAVPCKRGKSKSYPPKGPTTPSSSESDKGSSLTKIGKGNFVDSDSFGVVPYPDVYSPQIDFIRDMRSESKKKNIPIQSNVPQNAEFVFNDFEPSYDNYNPNVSNNVIHPTSKYSDQDMRNFDDSNVSRNSRRYQLKPPGLNVPDEFESKYQGLLTPNQLAPITSKIGYKDAININIHNRHEVLPAFLLAVSIRMSNFEGDIIGCFYSKISESDIDTIFLDLFDRWSFRPPKKLGLYFLNYDQYNRILNVSPYSLCLGNANRIFDLCCESVASCLDSNARLNKRHNHLNIDFLSFVELSSTELNSLALKGIRGSLSIYCGFSLYHFNSKSKLLYKKVLDCCDIYFHSLRDCPERFFYECALASVMNDFSSPLYNLPSYLLSPIGTTPYGISFVPVKKLDDLGSQETIIWYQFLDLFLSRYCIPNSYMSKDIYAARQYDLTKCMICKERGKESGHNFFDITKFCVTCSECSGGTRL